MNKFTIPDSGTTKTMVETHYYKWLVAQDKQDVHLVKTKLEYLSELGFVKGQHTLKEGDGQMLSFLEDAYFRLEIINKKKNEFQ